MQKPFAINDFILDDCSSYSGSAKANCTIKSIGLAQTGIGLPGTGVTYALRSGKWPVISSLGRSGLRHTLITYFLMQQATERKSKRDGLLAELNPERETLARLLVADYTPVEGLICAFGPWDIYENDAARWYCNSLRWERGGDGELDPIALATITGAIHIEDGLLDRQNAIVVEEATTNLITNPSFEVDTTGWTTYQLDTFNRITSDARFGAACAYMQDSAGGNAQIYMGAIAVGASTSYSFSAWIKKNVNAAGTGMLQVQWHTAGDVYISNSTTYFDAGDIAIWTRYVLTDTSPATAAKCYVVVAFVGTTGGEMWVDGVQLEENPYATSYCDGSLGPGYAWTGTPHASTSTRTATVVNLDNDVALISGKSTLSFRLVAQMPHDADASWPPPYLLSVTDATPTAGILIVYDSSSDIWIGWFDGSWYSLSGVQAFDAGDWLDIVLTVDYAGNALFYVDGVVAGSQDISALSPATITKWRLGGNWAGVDQGGFAFAEYAVFDRVLTAAEIAALYANQSAHYRARYQEVLCEASQPVVMDGIPTNRGNVSTLAVHKEVRWRSNDGDVFFMQADDDTWSNIVDIDSDDEVYPIIKIRPRAAKDVTNHGFRYKCPVLVEWKNPLPASQYPIRMELNTSTPIGASKMQSDGDDLRVYVNGVEVDRWVIGIDSAATYVWIHLNFAGLQSFTLNTAIAWDAITEIDLSDDDDLSAIPDTGLVLIGSEVFAYSGRDNINKQLTGVRRQERGSTPDTHSVGAAVKWIQYDVHIVYGDSSLSAPDVDNDYAPAFTLYTSDNDHWVYQDFGDDNLKRSAGWIKELIVDPGDFADIESDFQITTGDAWTLASPWVSVGIKSEFYTGDDPGSSSGPGAVGKKAQARWKAYNPNGIASVTLSNVSTNTSYTGLSKDVKNEIKLQSSEDGYNWINEAGIAAATTSFDANGKDKWAGLWSINEMYKAINDGTKCNATFEVDDATLTLCTTLTPDVTVRTEEASYHIKAVLWNLSTGDQLWIDYPLFDIDDILEIDTYNKTVIIVYGNLTTPYIAILSQPSAVGLKNSMRRDWFALIPGENTLQYSDAGTTNVDLHFAWERRYWE